MQVKSWFTVREQSKAIEEKGGDWASETTDLSKNENPLLMRMGDVAVVNKGKNSLLKRNNEWGAID